MDHIPCLAAWADSLDGIDYPLLSDFWPHGAVAQKYGVLRTEGYSERAIFVVDFEGVIQYIDLHDISHQPDNDVLLDELARIQNNPKLKPHKATDDDIKRLPKGGVVMYCTTWCSDCKQARKWLRERGIPYTEVNITETPGAAEQVKRWAEGNLTTPTFDIDNEVIVDFDIPKLKQTLKIAD